MLEPHRPLLYSDPCYLDHQTGDHPESPERLRRITAHLAHRPVLAQYAPTPVRAATRDELARVHRPEHIDFIRDSCRDMPGRIESDTIVSEKSYEVALKAAGAGLAAVDAVLDGKSSRALCLVRPPGHHALPHAPMGFCLFNNVAVAAAHARAKHGLNRVLIVDFDVHHGNGTQDMFYDSGHVYFVSVHRSPFYPGTGAAHETGRGEGLGTIFNLPLRFGVSRQDFRTQFETIVERAANRCKPELVLISAGFDAHAADPVGSLGLETEDFGPLTRCLVEAANQHCQGKIVSLLEGGYNVDKLAESVECHMEELAK
ncbi:MAG: histone deacetylase [Planctomycetaceae bacterium]|nr:MAG: histone deacetylase [Planctomycetaceae bacterium]